MIDIRKTIPKHKSRKLATRKPGSITRIVVHTTDSHNQDPNKTALYHITPGSQNHLSKKGAPGIAYHDFITKEGTVYHCNDYGDITWHSSGWNTSSIGVVMAFKTNNDQDGPTELQFLVNPS